MIKIIENDGYEYNIDEVEMIIIKNKLGNKFEFTTISNKTLEVNIKPRTQPHMMMKIQGEGMPIGNTGQFGDQLILIKPIIPDIIDETIIRSIVDSKTQ
jgi:DnaJ-class molecular chaperone